MSIVFTVIIEMCVLKVLFEISKQVVENKLVLLEIILYSL